MGQHKHNPTAIAAAHGELPPKPPKKSKRQRDAEMRMAVLAAEELQQTAKHYKGCSDDWYREACDYKAMLPRWIPVTERLPEEHEWVLCKCRAKIREVLSLRDGYWYHDPQHQYMSGFVTHWMPLPEPPKEENE